MIVMAYFFTFDQIVQCSMIWVTELAFLGKLSIFIYHGKTLKGLENALDQPVLSVFPKSYKALLVRDIGFTQRLCRIYRYIIFAYITLCVSIPFIEKSEERTLPLPAYTPCTITNNYCYVAMYVFQIINSYITSSTNINMELLFSVLITVSCCLFDILRNNLLDIDYSSERSASELRNNVILHYAIIK